MENKKKEKKILIFFDGFSTPLVFLGLIFYFFFGFYINENSAGAGGFNGDLKLIWSNFLLLKEGILSNLDNPLYNDSRPPLSYILHILFNPLLSNVETYRLSVLLISLIAPLLLFFSIKKNYFKLSNDIILLLAAVITLSPYFRTTAYWGLGENYGLIFLILAHLCFVKLREEKNNNLKNNFFLILMVCLFSSITVYFDQKLVFVPFFIFFSIIFSSFKNNIKLFSLFCFAIMALPYFYLITLWGSIIPTAAAEARKVGISLNLLQPMYCLTIIAFYIFPFFLINRTNLNLKKIKDKILTQKILLIVLVFSLYFLLSLYFDSFNSLTNDGKGAFFKLSIYFIENDFLRLIFTYIFSIISIFIIYFFFERNKKDFIFIFYFILLSLVTYPFYQEYLDPLIYILLFTFIKTKIDFNKKNIYFLVLYFLFFSISSKIYYQIIL